MFAKPYEIAPEPAVDRNEPIAVHDTLTILSESFELVSAPGIPGDVCGELEFILKNPDQFPGIVIREDPGRDRFFDLICDGRIYFIYVYSAGKRVMLLASCRGKRQPSSVAGRNA